MFLAVHLHPEEVDGLDRVAAHYGFPSRAEAYRAGMRIAVEALRAEGDLVGVRRRRPGRVGEGLKVMPDDFAAVDAAAKQLGVGRSAVVRWGCLQLIATVNRELACGQM